MRMLAFLPLFLCFHAVAGAESKTPDFEVTIVHHTLRAPRAIPVEVVTEIRNVGGRPITVAKITSRDGYVRSGAFARHERDALPRRPRAGPTERRLDNAPVANDGVGGEPSRRAGLSTTVVETSGVVQCRSRQLPLQAWRRRDAGALARIRHSRNPGVGSPALGSEFGALLVACWRMRYG